MVTAAGPPGAVPRARRSSQSSALKSLADRLFATRDRKGPLLKRPTPAKARRIGSELLFSASREKSGSCWSEAFECYTTGSGVLPRSGPMRAEARGCRFGFGGAKAFPEGGGRCDLRSVQALARPGPPLTPAWRETAGLRDAPECQVGTDPRA